MPCLTILGVFAGGMCVIIGIVGGQFRALFLGVIILLLTLGGTTFLP